MCPLLVTSTLVCGGRNQTGAAPLGGAARRSRVTHPLTVRHSGDMPDQGDEEWLWDIDPTVDYITQGGHSAAALQFPDDLLRHSTRVAALLAAKLGSRCRVYVLAVRPPPGAAVDCQLLCHSLHAKSNHHHAPWPGLPLTSASGLHHPQPGLAACPAGVLNASMSPSPSTCRTRLTTRLPLTRWQHSMYQPVAW